MLNFFYTHPPFAPLYGALPLCPSSSLSSPVSLPVNDWQFWVVTLLAAVALFYVLREVVPDSFWPRRFRRKGQRRATLTLDGKPVEKK